MPSPEQGVLDPPEEATVSLPEDTYAPEVFDIQTKPEIPVPGPGDFIIRRTTKLGHLTMTKMHITTHPLLRVHR